MNANTNRRKKYIRRAIAVVGMLVCLIVPLSLIQHYLCFPPSGDMVRLGQFEKEPENSIDVIALGSSATYTGYSAAYAYKEFGFTSYPYALSGSYCNIWKLAVQNILRTQKPKLVVVDVFGGSYRHEAGAKRDSAVYMLSESMPLSLEKIRTLKEIAKTTETATPLSLSFPIIKYHANYTKTLKSLKGRIAIERYGPSPLKGIEDNSFVGDLKPLTEESITSETEPLDKETEEIICSFIDYCKENDVQLLFVKLPFVPVYEKDFVASKKQNRVLELAESKGCATLNLQTSFYEIGLDPATDYGDRGHVNIFGQKKVTEAIGSYVQEQMGIGPSELDGPVKDSWEEAVRYYDAFYSMSEELIAEGSNQHLTDSPPLVDTVKRYMDEHD